MVLTTRNEGNDRSDGKCKSGLEPEASPDRGVLFLPLSYLLAVITVISCHLSTMLSRGLGTLNVTICHSPYLSVIGDLVNFSKRIIGSPLPSLSSYYCYSHMAQGTFCSYMGSQLPNYPAVDSYPELIHMDPYRGQFCGGNTEETRKTVNLLS